MNQSWLFFTGGLLLIGASFFVDRMLPSEAVWTDEKAGQFSEVRAQLHALAHQTIHQNSESEKARLEAEIRQKEAAFNRFEAELEAARDRSLWLGRAIGVVGMIVCIAGAVSEKQQG